MVGGMAVMEGASGERRKEWVKLKMGGVDG
jgi:hypothetical protein